MRGEGLLVMKGDVTRCSIKEDGAAHEANGSAQLTLAIEVFAGDAADTLVREDMITRKDLESDDYP